MTRDGVLRILLVNQFYPPDMAPTGQCLHDLARCLVGRGHSVEVRDGGRAAREADPMFYQKLAAARRAAIAS